MSTIEYMPLNLKHKTINRWRLSKLEEKTVSFTPMTMEGDINKWLIEGFAINENPCKTEFRENRRGNIPENPLLINSSVSDWEVYFPWENPAVERSGFWFVPTYLKSYGITYLECNYAHKAVLNLRTCGGMTLWINDNFITDFTPFTRNIEGNVEVEVELKKGANKLIVCFDDLAERDTYYYFRIDYTGQDEVKIILPVDENDKNEIYEIEKMLSEAIFIDDIIKEGEVSLKINNLLNRDIEFEFSYETEQLTDNDCKKKTKAVLKKGDNKLNMGNVSEFPMGFNYIDLVTTIGDVKVTKKLGVMIFDSNCCDNKDALTIQQRKIEALKYVAQYGDFNIHKALAILSTGGDIKEAESIILRGLDGINNRRDCSDFYLISMFRIWKEYREAKFFSEEFWAQVKSTILNFRYWIDEPGDDVMWFFSENHALLFHSCELLASQLFPEDIFTNSNEDGNYHRIKSENLLMHWFERFLIEGLAEWNSSMYMPIDFVGIINIYDLAESKELRDLAKKALDLIYYILAVNSHKGIMGTTFGRCYEKELKGHYANGTTSLMWIGYGVGYLNNYSISNVSFCLSDYEPPIEYKKYVTMDHMDSYVFKNEQGYEGYAKVYNYKTKDFSLSSIYNFRAGKKGYQEHVVEAIIDPETQVWVNHPGQMYHFSKGRPNFWAGNGYLPNVLQYKGLSILIFKIDEDHDADYTHAYFPTMKFDEIKYKDNWVFAKKENAFIGIYANNGLTLQTQGFNKDKELISKGRNNLWLLRMSNNKEFNSFEEFISAMENTAINFSESLELSIKESIYGQIKGSFNGQLEVEGIKQDIEKVGVKGVIEFLQ
jgi:hypothetical protein